jgi:hypothetical protein
MFTACRCIKLRMSVPNCSLIIVIKSKGKENLRTAATSFFYILHKTRLTNVTFSFNSATITKVKVFRLRYPGFQSTGYLVYLENIVRRFLSTNLSH